MTRTTISIEPDLLQHAKDSANEIGTSFSGIVRLALREFLGGERTDIYASAMEEAYMLAASKVKQAIEVALQDAVQDISNDLDERCE